MLASFLITFREGLEAFLLVGILLAYLEKVSALRYRRYVFYGVAAGLLSSLAAAFVFQLVISQFESDYYRSCLQIAVLLFASGMLSYIAIWMQRQARERTAAFQEQLGAHISSGNLLGMVSLSFVAVLREGFEAVFFFSALSFGSEQLSFASGLAGGFAGISAAIAAVYAMLRSSRHVPLAAFFKYTSLLILVIAAGLLGSSINLMQAVGWLPIGLARAFDISFLLGDQQGLGLFLRALFGYNASPSWLQFAVWVGYLALSEERTER